MGYTTIGTALFNKVDAVSDLDFTYNYEPKELAKYPCATVSALSHANTFADTAANRREMVFIIRVYFRTDQTDYERIMRTTVDAIMEAVETDPSLSGACDFAEPSEAKWFFQEREVPVRVCEITVNCVFRKNR